MNTIEKITHGIALLNLECSSDAINCFSTYLTLLESWNQKIDLTAVSPDEYIPRHLLDSLALCHLSEVKEATSVIDLGTGAGLPGIPLAVIFPHIKFHLVDSRDKRIVFLRDVIDKLSLKNVLLTHGRGEELAHRELRETFDLMVSRAVAHIRILLEIGAGFVSHGGSIVSMKGENCEDEIQEVGDLHEELQLTQPRLITRNESFLPSGASIVIARKIGSCPINRPLSWKRMEKGVLQSSSLRKQ